MALRVDLASRHVETEARGVRVGRKGGEGLPSKKKEAVKVQRRVRVSKASCENRSKRADGWQTGVWALKLD